MAWDYRENWGVIAEYGELQSDPTVEHHEVRKYKGVRYSITYPEGWPFIRCYEDERGHVIAVNGEIPEPFIEILSDEKPEDMCV